MYMKISRLASVFFGLAFVASGICGAAQGKKIKIITSLFPLYDFSKNTGGDKVEVSLLMPPGMEPHDFEPKAGDILKIGTADIFIYTGRSMEPWVDKVLKGVANSRALAIDSSNGVFLMKAEGTEEGAGKKIDPHIWLDFSNAQIMVDNILAALAQKDPGNKEFYTKNANEYKTRLASLDKEYRDALGSCRKKIFIQGGHHTFGYLARRYNLDYISALGISPNAEPNTRSLIELSKKIKQNGLSYIYFEELLSAKVAKTISMETGAKMLELHGAHNLTKHEMQNGTSFISLMEHNLENLKIGLQCK